MKRHLIALLLLASCATTRTAEECIASADASREQLTASDLICIIKSHKQEMVGCKLRGRDDSFEGMMKVHLVVHRDGSTSDARYTPVTLQPSAIGECLVAAVLTWKFPQFTGRPMPIDFEVPVRR